MMEQMVGRPRGVDMKNITGRSSVRIQRRIILAAAYALLATGIAFGAAGTSGRGTPTTTSRPPVVSDANKKAAQAQYSKAYDLYTAEKFADAQKENDKALTLDPTNSNALILQKILSGRLAGGSSSGTTSGTASTGGGGSGAAKPGVLTSQQISLIRLLETPTIDASLKGKIDRKTLEDFWNEVRSKDAMVNDKSKAAMDAFINPANFAQQASTIRDDGQRKYLEKLTITSDPSPLAAFRSTPNGINPYMLQNCATSECHGGDKGGNFRLLNPASTVEQQYTNFYIMSMYANKDGKMIDRDNPDKSLFLQYSLPSSAAQFKHPKVETRKIPNTQDKRYTDFVDWVKTLILPKPNYDIKFDLPGTK